MKQKFSHARDYVDIGLLLRDGFAWDLEAMAAKVTDKLIARLPDQA